MLEQKNTVNWQWQKFAELSVSQLDKIYRLRQQVFVVEQDCPYVDADGHDKDAIHCLGFMGDELIATLRFFPRFPEFDNHASIGRVCTSSKVRGSGLGKTLIEQALIYADNHYPQQKIQIGAQSYLVKFYQAFGFSVISDEYLEDGIPHKHMLREAAAS
jgi:ElaA protein